MPEFDRTSKEHVELVITPAAANVTAVDVVGEIIDTIDYGSLAFILNVAVVTTGTLTVSLTESDYSDGSTASAVPAGEVINPDGSTGNSLAIAATSGSTGVYHIGTVGKKRYQIFTVDALGIGSTGGTGAVSAVAIQAHGRDNPTE
jgi:hypothetical protein